MRGRSHVAPGEAGQDGSKAFPPTLGRDATATSAYEGGVTGGSLSHHRIIALRPQRRNLRN
ncbi:MAG: hypothetical protein OJF49_003823 [Ktedonobacterales bacterium]|nr:MAG: hypothetical protein OJF49_003823 [Ktedonobacterales bacterium]